MNIVEENRTRELDERKTTVIADGGKKRRATTGNQF